jgi:hypothetical protein
MVPRAREVICGREAGDRKRSASGHVALDSPTFSQSRREYVQREQALHITARSQVMRAEEALLAIRSFRTGNRDEQRESFTTTKQALDNGRPPRTTPLTVTRTLRLKHSRMHHCADNSQLLPQPTFAISPDS